MFDPSAYRPGAWPRRWTPRALLTGAPAASAFLLTLLVTTATLAGTGTDAERWVMASASTNLHSMTWRPMYALLISAFWVQTLSAIWPMVLLMLFVMAPAERLLGTTRTLLVFAAGHIGATVATVVGIAVGVTYGWLPHALVHAVDVGPSYGLVALTA